jgi:hypothetical protein
MNFDNVISVLKDSAKHAKDYYYNAKRLYELYPKDEMFEQRYNRASEIFCEYCLLSNKLDIELFD